MEPDATIPPSSPRDKLKIVIGAMYGLWGVGFFIHFLPLVALMIAIVKRSDAQGTMYESHCVWVIRTFAIGICAGLPGAILLALPLIHPIGLLILGSIGLWALYRLIKGLLRFIDDKPLDAPKALF